MAPIARYLWCTLFCALFLAELALAAARPPPKDHGTNKWLARALRNADGAPLVPAGGYPTDDSTGAPGTRPGYVKYRTGNGASGKPGMQDLNPGGDAPHAVEGRQARKARETERAAKRRNSKAAEAVQEKRGAESGDTQGAAAGHD